MEENTLSSNNGRGHNQNVSPVAAFAGKYLTFALVDECYGLDILQVQEIIGIIPITPVPKSPEYLKGVINLRGKIIPVIDLRAKLGIEPAPYDDKTCIIVVNSEIHEQKVAIGVVVDTVLEVANFETPQLQLPPEYGAELDTSFILAMGKLENQFVILIDIDRAIDGVEVPPELLN